MILAKKEVFHWFHSETTPEIGGNVELFQNVLLKSMKTMQIRHCMICNWKDYVDNYSHSSVCHKIGFYNPTKIFKQEKADLLKPNGKVIISQIF